ncbi:excalibur calcium-binding domain-containing protein [Nocardioides sp.]|uniref:excalibur calcium-binding domain-containing protein n=1 Tax=Nocardioides sp. TaxID=35761 RepID=UPI002ED6BD9C
MLRAAKTGLIAVVMTVSMLAFAGPAEAVTDYRNCDHMHKTYKNGVAKSKKAANRQVNSGHKRPAVRPKVYRANIESDADKDGTACEVSA